MLLSLGNIGSTYTVKSISNEDEELMDFLFTLGCYEGEKISLVSEISGNLVVSIRDGRYNIDKNLASLIVVED